MRTRSSCRLIAVCLWLAAGAAAFAQQGFYLRPNDTVVFYGDSITDQRLYTTFVETFTLTRYPGLPVRFVHSGWGGDRVTGGGGGPVDERLRRDVIAYRPTVMTIMLGMNDGRVRAFDEAVFKTFADGYEHILQFMKAAAPGLRMTLIQPSPCDDVTRAPNFEGGYNAVLVRYGQFVKELAARNGHATADLNTAVVAALRKARAADPDGAQRIIPDRVHPGPGGHLLMAAELLKAWGAGPTVTSVEIDAAALRPGRVENAEVSGLARGNGISWTQKDRALPMPVNLQDPPTALAVRSSDFTERLNQQSLRVTGLAQGSWVLKINGTTVGSYTAGQLASGINLAELPTPMLKQAAGVHALTLKRTSVHQIRWRQLQMALQEDNLPRMASILDNLDALDDELAARQRAAAQPAACFYELIPR
ncbi:MAG: SGNH/GDSL hydrolase family protein [Bryobacterales bacterium]|nr:SGNH/GDSL hydrolase family protein [Bryobacterales bacterium]